MKVVFLDFDGVLNSETSFLYEHNRRARDKEHGVGGKVNETLSLHCCAAFREVLLTYPDLKVVLSTTWRELYDLPWLKAKLEEYHIDSSRVIGITPENRFAIERGDEIRQWLKEHPEVDHYVVIDDNDQLKEIRAGQWTMEQIETYFMAKEKSLEELYVKSTLRHRPDEPVIKKLLLEVLEEHFGTLQGMIETADHYKDMLRQIQQIVSKV